MCNLLGRDAPFQVFVADLIPAVPVGDVHGKIPFALVLEMHFLASLPGNFG